MTNEFNLKKTEGNIMKKFLKFLKWTGICILTLIIGFVVFVYARTNRTFDAPYPEITASTDSSLIARGEYLVYGPAHCAYCHAPISEYERLNAGKKVLMSGGFDFVLPVGVVHTPNITTDKETGIGAYTDQELARSLRFGVKRNGQALIDFMPFYDLSDRDLTAIISYLRTTAPVKNKRPEHKWNFMGKAVMALGMIKPMGDGTVPPAPEPDSTAAYGKYLAESVANCRGCHTNRDMMSGAYIGTDYAGQTKFEVIDDHGQIIKGKHLVTPNITPDPETGRMAFWNQEVFTTRFRVGSVIPGTPMPWGPYSRMTDLELKAIFKYLHSLEPVHTATPVGIQEGDPY
jgi:mono/diheme cytochrome c family protein